MRNNALNLKKIKLFLIFILIILVFLSALFFIINKRISGKTAYAEDRPASGLEFYLIGDSYEVIKCTAENTTKIIIPSSYNGKPVIGIGYGAFSDCPLLKSIVIPDSVTFISDNAFSGCSSLDSITIPNSVIYIKDGVFSGCSSLTSITIPDSVIYIKDGVFSGCSSLTSITIPKNVTQIGSKSANIFLGCSKLETINVDDNNPNYASEGGVLFSKKKDALLCCPGGKADGYQIPDSIETIEYNAFYGCSLFTSITIPDRVRSIPYNPFIGCSKLEKIIVDDNNTEYASEDGVLIDKTNYLISCPGGKSGDYTIPDYIEVIQYNAFDGCSLLTNITIPNSVSHISQDAFKDCSMLTSIIIPYSIRNIAYNPFIGCSKLGTINVDGGNPEYASEDGVLFSKDKSLLICYPGGKEGAYQIPVYTTNVWVDAFYGCGLLTRITIPDNANGTNISTNPFKGCNNLTEIEVGENNTSYASKDGVLFNKDKSWLICCPSGKSGVYQIPDSVQFIVDYAFYGCSLLTDILIPESVEYIYNYAFYGCSSLTSITIPASINYLYVGTSFSNCKNLKAVNILRPKSEVITYFHIDAANPFPVEKSPKLKIYVPVDSIDEYKSNNNMCHYLIFTDTTGPKFNGAENNKFYKQNLNITVTDNESGLKSVVLNGEKATDNLKLSQEGIYNLTAEDIYGNTSTIYFVINKAIIYTSNVIDYEATNGNVIINNGEALNIVLLKNRQKVNYEFLQEISEDGSYTAILSDSFGNSEAINFIIIKKPKRVFEYTCAEGYEIIKYTKDGTEQTLPSNTTVKKFDTDGVYTVVVKNALIDYTFTFSVTIDTVLPEISLTNVKNGLADNSVKMKSVSKNNVTIVVTQNGNIIDAGIGTILRENGEYSIELTDEAGNINVYNFTIDKHPSWEAFIISGAAGIALVTVFGIIGHLRRKKNFKNV